MDRENALNYLEPLENRTRNVAVQDALAEMVERAGLKIGDRLPPELSLASSLGVGRSTIREALNRWEGLGVIRRRRGDGTYLTANVQTSRGLIPTMVRLEGEALLRLLEIRRTLEIDVVRKATIHASEAQRKEISRLGDILLKAVNGGHPWRKEDHAFHDAIYHASGNPMYGQILTNLDHALERDVNSPYNRDAFGLGSFPMHKDLADAILASNPDRAVQAISEVIDNVEFEIRAILAATKDS
ncbi:FadR/GntR family transcriptional regulator [Devosia sp. MC521]|uniref:FadR/GntR family transcriptional regulator n=1 Tax=Devosia sp. MC521 TaxID=2759954 RepID=UPI0015F7FBAB|nr:FadR/GntR family transcriptional regulator [Devosia sp. MC521]MBJ6987521.1 FadR family transcriptional regulator [Devosia sp. MC521]QMW61879.1 FadR family transcriptional regulator [Devosia sp. MC521]